MIKLRFLFFWIFFLCPLSVFPASPLFHTVIAEKWLAAFEDFNESEKQAFFLGTLFPDIRYLAGIPRDVTHDRGLTLEQIKATKDPFQKGVRVHSFVDEQRVEFLKNQDVLKIFDEISGDKILYLKFLEDEILYPMQKENHFFYVCEYLKNFDESELEFKISQEILAEWHDIHRKYLSMRPSAALEKSISSGQGFSNISIQSTKNCCKVMQQFCENEKAINYVSSAIEEFDRIFSQ